MKMKKNPVVQYPKDQCNITVLDTTNSGCIHFPISVYI